MAKSEIPARKQTPEVLAANVHADAAENLTLSDGFYKIVHLDAARKYFSMETLLHLIDDMAALGYNQLELYLSDNQGFRLILDNPIIETAYGTYELDDGIVNSGYTQDYNPGDGYFRPSQEFAKGKKYYLTQSEMTELVSYAAAKGIEVVPSINMPGHMGAILMNMPDNWHYYYNGKLSRSSMDLDNEEAVAFSQALLAKYVTYFAEIADASGNRLVRHFSIGADEYGFDVGMKLGSIGTGLHDKIVDFMDRCAGTIHTAGSGTITPRAFNDFFSGSKMPTKEFEVYYWSGTNARDLQRAGYRIINASDSCYYAVGSTYYTSEKNPASGVGSFDPMTVSCLPSASCELSSMPAGVMVCIWCDRGYYGDDAAADIAQDAGKSVYEGTKHHIAAFANLWNTSGERSKPAAAAP